MTELKTLKDIRTYQFDDPDGLCPEELREEAIKWIKELRKAIKDEDTKLIYVLIDCEGRNLISKAEGAIAILKRINNLTEEDLK